MNNVSLPEITTEALVLSARSWLLIGLTFFFRFAAAVSGIFPIVFLLSILIRILISAPVDINGDPDPLLLGQLVFSDNNSILATSGIVAAVFVLQMVLYSLMDAGLLGEIARAIKEDQRPRVKGFGTSAIKFFPQILTIRLLACFLGIFTGLAFVAFIVFSFNLLGLQFFTQKTNIYSYVYLGIVVLAFISVFYVFFLSVLMISGISVSLKEANLMKSLSLSVDYLKQNSLVISLSVMFLLLIFTFYQVVGVLGGIWWSKAIALSGGAEIFSTASTAWSLTLSIMNQIILVFAICFQMILFYRIQQKGTNPDGI